MRRGNERYEVLVAGEVLRQEHEVPRFAVALRPRIPVEAVVPRDVRLDSDDRLDPRVSAERVEVDRAVERAVIGEPEGGHVQGLRTSDEVAQPRQPIEQAVFAMGVQMDEIPCDGPAPRMCRSRKPGGHGQSSGRLERLQHHERDDHRSTDEIGA